MLAPLSRVVSAYWTVNIKLDSFVKGLDLIDVD